MTNVVKTDNNTLLGLENAYLSFDEAASRFLATRKSERTRKTYERALTLFRDHSARLELDPLKGDALIIYSEQANAQRRDRGGELANDTIRLRLKAVQSLFTWLYTFGLSSLKPELVAEVLTMPPARKLSPRDILTKAEARELLATAEPGRDAGLVRVMLDCGLRVSEALALRDDDIYTADNRYYIHVASGKGDKERDVETPPDLWRELGELGDPLFSLDRSNAWRVVQRTAARAGLQKHVTPHALRHTHAHQLRLQGWPLEAIADRLGHTNLDTTKMYTRPAELARQIELPVMPWARAT